MDKSKEEKDKYQYEIFILTIIIFFIIFAYRNKTTKKLIYKLIKQEHKLKNEGYLGIIIFIIIGVLLNQGVIFYILVNTSSGFIFGFKKGLIIAYIIVLISSFIGFYLSRYIFKDKIVNTMKNNKKLNKIYELQYNLSFFQWIKYIILLRISPISFNLNNYLLGTTNVDIFTYMIGTSIGVLFWLIPEVYVGHNIKNINKLYKFI